MTRSVGQRRAERDFERGGEGSDRASGERFIGVPAKAELERRLDGATPENPVVLGDYRVLRRVGAGGMGIVYEALDVRSHRVALKILRERDAVALSRLKEEFRLVADLTDEHLATVYELVLEGTDAYVVLPFIDGVDFLAYVRSAPVYDGATVGPGDAPVASDAPAVGIVGPFDIARLRPALLKLARAVRCLHQAGRLHRDLKPSNVLVEPSGKVVVLDFGLVRERVDPRDVGGVLGTPSHMSPEQARGEPAEAASDWYAFGVILYQALTGRLPFDGTVEEVLTRKQVEVPLRPSTLAANVPEELDYLAMRLLAIAPAERPRAHQVFEILWATEDSEAGALPPPASPPPYSSPQPRFVGRTRELTCLEEAFRRAARGGCVVRWVHGGSGIGKSALLSEFIDRAVANAPDTLVFRGRCHARESVPYKAFDAIVERLSRELTRESVRRALGPTPLERSDLVAMFPALQRVLSAETTLVPDGERDPTDCRATALRGLKALLRQLGETRPIVLAVDDLQWADSDSVHLLRELTAAPNAPRMLFVGLYRTEEEDRSSFLREVMRILPDEMVTGEASISLAPLSPSESLQLASARLGERAGVGAEAITRAAAGHPFFIEELVRYATRQSSRADEAPSLDDVLLARVHDLPRDAREILELVSVAGEAVTYSTIVRATSVGADTVQTLKRLSSASLIRLNGLRNDDRVEIYHDRIRESVVAALPKELLARHHLALGLALDTPGAHPEILARHFLGGGSRERGSRYALEAAGRSSRALAFEHAVELYDLALAAGCLSDRETRAVRLERAEALVNAGRTAEAAATYFEESRSATGLESLDLRRRAAEQYLVTGRYVEGSEILKSVLRDVGLPMPSTPGRALLRMTVGLAEIAAYRHGLWTRRPSAGALTGARRDACFAAARGLSAFDVASGAYFCVQTLRLAQASKDPHFMSMGSSAVGTLLAYGNRDPLAKWGRALLEDGVELGRGATDPGIPAHAQLHQGMSFMSAGQWERAVTTLTPALETLATRCTGYHYERAYGEMSAILCLEALGRLREVRARADRSLRQGDAVGNLYLRVQGRLYLAVCDVVAGRLQEAEANERALGEWMPVERGFLFQHWLGLKAKAYRTLYAGRPEEALEALDTAWPGLVRSNLLAIQFLRVFAIHLRAVALIHVARRKASARGRLLDAALREATQLARSGAPAGTAASHAIRGAVAREREKRTVALRHFAASRKMYVDLGMRIHAQAVQRQLSTLDRHPESAVTLTRLDDAMREEGVVDPARWSALLAP